MPLWKRLTATMIPEIAGGRSSVEAPEHSLLVWGGIEMVETHSAGARLRRSSSAFADGAGGRSMYHPPMPVPSPPDLDTARRLSLEQLARVCPQLARFTGYRFLDAYEGAAGVFVVYTTGAQIFLSTMRDGPTAVEVADRPRWTSEFAMPCARALAAGAIQAGDANGRLEVSEEDSDWAWDADSKCPVPPPGGLLQRWLRDLPWGKTGDELDSTIQLAGLWDEGKTTLTLLLRDVIVGLFAAAEQGSVAMLRILVIVLRALPSALRSRRDLVSAWQTAAAGRVGYAPGQRL